METLLCVVTGGWGALCPAYALHVALGVHDQAVFIGGIVGLQVYRVITHGTDEILLARSVGLAHESLISPNVWLVYHQMFPTEQTVVRYLTPLPCIDTPCESSYGRVMLDVELNPCWICAKLVRFEDTKPDEFGFFVHESCLQLAAKKEVRETA
jgi:hypothetical protein